ncbi:hypothetical protein EBT31_18945, partial [bacterium]|nr:hypothetical protein [bacterium]
GSGQPSKVGINNPNPTQALDVNGKVKANSILLPDGSELLNANNFGQFNVTDQDVGYTWIQSGSLQADRSYDAMTVVSGCHINVDIDPTLDAIRICHSDTSNQGNIANSPYYFVKSLGFDDMGHVTNATVQLESNGFANVVIDNGNTFNYNWSTQSGAYLLADTPVDQLTVVGGIGIIAGLSSTYDAIRISHEDTSDVRDITAAANGAVFVNALTFDTFGHVTSANCGVESPAFANVIIHNVDTAHTWSNVENDYVQANNWQGQLQLYSGLGIDLSVDRLGDSLRISHEDTSQVSNVTPSTVRTYLNSITFDTFGHAQSIGTGTVAEYTITTGSVDSNTANIRLIGTDGTAPSINVKSGTGIRVYQESANNINISGLQYNMTASDTSNGANITLTGTGYTSLTDNIKFANGSNMIITRTDAHTITFTATADADTLYTAGNISGTITLDRNNGTIQKVTATGDFNLSGISNMSAGNISGASV